MFFSFLFLFGTWRSEEQQKKSIFSLSSSFFLTELLVRPHDAQALPVLAAERQREGDVDGLLGGRGAAGRFQGGSAGRGTSRGDEPRRRRRRGRARCPRRVSCRRLFPGRGRRRTGARLALLLLLLLSQRRGRGRRRRRSRRSRRRRRQGRRSRRPKCCLLLARGGGIRLRSRSGAGASLASSSLSLRHEGFFSLCFEFETFQGEEEGEHASEREKKRERKDSKR